jgi:hypothetical protein
MMSSLTVMPQIMKSMAEFEHLPPIRQFQILWCALIAFSLMLDFPAQLRFYRWFHHSGLQMAKVSGHGQSAGKFYGFIPSPRLSVAETTAVGFALISSLLLACTDLCDPRIWLGVALVCHHCYISQIYAEVHVVAHNMALVPPALILCMVSPDIVASSSEEFNALAPAAHWPLFLLKFVATSAYCSAAVCKITKCFTDNADWSSGSTMQAVMLEAIMGLNLPGGEAAHMTFSKPTPFSRAMQRCLFCWPRVLGLMSVYGVVVELLAPLVLVLPNFGIPFAVLGLGLHYGIAYLQNIDFIAWWGPFYVVFFVGGSWSMFFEGSSHPAAQIHKMATDYAAAHPVGFALGLAYLAIHLGGMIIHRIWTSIDMLPLSRFPMFDSPKNVWDPSKPHWAWLTDKKQAPGELMNFAFPCCRPQHVLPSEMDLLPFKHFLFGKATPDDKTMTIYTNVVVTEELQSVLDRFWEEWHKGAEKANDPATCAAMLDLVDDAKAAFAKAPRRTAQAQVAEAPEESPGLLGRCGRRLLGSVSGKKDSSLIAPLLSAEAVTTHRNKDSVYMKPLLSIETARSPVKKAASLIKPLLAAEATQPVYFDDVAFA